jgi:hypothetical protein
MVGTAALPTYNAETSSSERAEEKKMKSSKIPSKSGATWPTVPVPTAKLDPE